MLSCELASKDEASATNSIEAAPKMRSGHRGSFARNSLILSGGAGTAGALSLLALAAQSAQTPKASTLGKLRGVQSRSNSAAGASDSLLADPGSALPGRTMLASMCAVDANRFLLLGGAGADGTIWPTSLRRATLERQAGGTNFALHWERLTSQNSRLHAQAAHVTELIDGKVYVYGGHDEGRNTLDVVTVGEVKEAPKDSAAPISTVSWRTLYQSDASHLHATTTLSRIVNKRLVLVGTSAAHRNVLHSVRFIDLSAISETAALATRIQKSLTPDIRELDKLVNIFGKLLEIKVGDDLEKLLKVMDAILSIKLKTPEIDLQIEIVAESIAYLKVQSAQTDREEKLLDQVTKNWRDVKKHAPKKKDDITPQREQQTAIIKNDIQARAHAYMHAHAHFHASPHSLYRHHRRAWQILSDRVEGQRREFDKCAVFKWETGVKHAYEHLVSFHYRLLELEIEMARLLRLTVSLCVHAHHCGLLDCVLLK